MGMWETHWGLVGEDEKRQGERVKEREDETDTHHLMQEGDLM